MMPIIDYKAQALEMLAKMENQRLINMAYGFVSQLYKNEQEESHERKDK